MAITAQASKKSKQTLLSLIVILLLGWLTLFSWAFGLWCFFGFNAAWTSLTTLARQQTTAVAEVTDVAAIGKNIQAGLDSIPTPAFTQTIHQVGELIQHRLNTVLPEKSSELDEFFTLGNNAWRLIQWSAQLLILKLLILITALPLFALALIVGLIDGLNQRAIRTASLGRESSYVFHQLNRYFRQGLLLLIALWLAIPFSMQPAVVFVPVSLLLALMVSLAASRFKKYW